MNLKTAEWNELYNGNETKRKREIKFEWFNAWTTNRVSKEVWGEKLKKLIHCDKGVKLDSLEEWGEYGLRMNHFGLSSSIE